MVRLRGVQLESKHVNNFKQTNLYISQQITPKDHTSAALVSRPSDISSAGGRVRRRGKLWRSAA